MENLWFEMIGEIDESFHLSAPIITSENERVLESLDDEFGTKDFIDELIESTTATERTGYNHLKKLEKDGEIEKVKHGRYRKTDDGV